MTDYVVTAPDGNKYKIGAPEGTTQDQALEHFKSEWAAGRVQKPDPSNLGPMASKIDPGPFIKGTGEFFGAMPQGVLGIPEAAYQYGEHLFGLPHPGHWADPLRRYRDWADSTWPGIAGEMVGGTAAFTGLGALGNAARLTPQVAKLPFLATPAARTIAANLAESQVSQPTSGDDFWTQKGISGALGALIGRWLGRPKQQAARNIAEKTNEQIADENAKALKATEDANKAAATAHAQTVKTEAEQHKALSEAQEQFHQQQREAAQQAAKALSERTNQALAQREGQVAAAREVPAATTQGWWDRTLGLIGVKDPSIRTGPATGAKVRDIVGGRRNEILNRMQLNSGDQAFTTRLNTIRDETMKDLPKSAKNKFYKPPREQDLASPIIDPITGKPLPRATPAVVGKPGTATGDWVKTVMEPLAKGNLSGRQLSDYISRLGARAEELAQDAARVPQDERAEMYAMSNAYRDVADAVVGHAAGVGENAAADKLALDAANKAYTMWSIGNDAARAERGGIASPDQLIVSAKRRLRGEARYEQALNNPQSPYHDVVNWLQAQRDAHRVRVPSEKEVRRAQPPGPEIPPAKPTPIPPPAPRHAASPQQPPTPRDLVPVPAAPSRPRYNLGQDAAIAGAAYYLGHPYVAGLWGLHTLRDILSGGHGGQEKMIERQVRKLMQNYPRLSRPIVPAAGTAAGQAGRVTPEEYRQPIGDIGQTVPDMFYSWGSSQ